MLKKIFSEGKSRRHFLKSSSLLGGLAFLAPVANAFGKSKKSIELANNLGELRFVHTAGLKGQSGPTLKGQFGGLNDIAESLAEATFNGLKIDAGDFLDPSQSFSDNLEFVKNLSNYGLHLAGLGKTELDLSEDQLLELTKKATFSLVNTNYRFINPELDQVINKHLIVNFGKYKMGVIAVADEFGSLPKNVRNPIKSALRESELLKSFHSCDMVVCLVNFDSNPDIQNPSIDRLAEKAEHIDFILSANTTSTRPGLNLIKDRSGEDVLISTVMDSGKYLGDFSVTFTPKYAKCMVANHSRIPGPKNQTQATSIIHEISTQSI
ncbi:hypothetical protein P872_12710 [Rhodonellum psychrophilum GCM71 = DSM 17998]|uniref:Uncharacterized protein n=2 Tax=Rhodonellum TaxID=336827 RepID=U5BXE2_9BACT|nr:MULTISPECIES: hypothetical protein [Rhodonellum]ERM80582.1 hypothetical protein P872_12710 [Rhodonellum psychrophilum GCM71 = DSM 17998]SDZ51141.1 hypothetical protein SAMN05444412_11910 [Rhodonellum ikkaensis]